MVGIKRLADHLNLSIGTVSRALNDRPDVNEDTRKRVLQAASDLNYVANQSGRSLRSGLTGAIGFMVQTGPQFNVQGDNFFTTVFDGVQTVLNRHHLDLIVLLCSASEDPDQYLRRMVLRRFVDGMIISHTLREDPRIAFLASRRLPFVTLGRSQTDAGQSWLDIDFDAIGRRAVERFVQRGHRNIAVALPLDDINLGHVLHAAVAATMAQNGLTLTAANTLRSHPGEIGGHEVARQLLALSPRPTAIVLSDDSLAVGLYRGLMENGILPGRDISIIGRDSLPVRFLSPTLTRFGQSLRNLGIDLGEALLASMPAYERLYPLGRVRKVLDMQFFEGESDALTIAN
ncbi:MAG: LacI family DNA-binding transcriptional regulator [Pseudomonadota bacterium]